MPTPEVAFDWVDDRAGLEALVERLVDEPAYGIDTEFHRERTYWPQIALVQLSWAGGHVALVDPLAVDLGPLARLLTAGGVAVAHAADQDLEVLDRACGAIPSRLFDTQLAAGFLGHSTPSLSSLVTMTVGVPRRGWPGPAAISVLIRPRARTSSAAEPVAVVSVG